MSALKRILQIAGVAAAAAAVAAFVKNRLVPEPQHLDGPAPPFRVAEPGRAAVRPDTAADDLTEIHGIGPVYAGRLTESGIASFAGLAAADAAAIAEIAGVSDDLAAEWIAAAGELSR